MIGAAPLTLESSMKKLLIGLALASLTVACKSTAEVSDSSCPTCENKAACEGKAECDKAKADCGECPMMKGTCDESKAAECEGATCPMTGKTNS
jgi:hypothetical protein